MTFTNEFPKQQVIIETIKKVGDLTHISESLVHYRDFKGYLDKVVYYTIKGDKNAWNEIKSSFKYDEMMGKVKDVYTDSFGRKMKVTLQK